MTEILESLSEKAREGFLRIAAGANDILHEGIAAVTSVISGGYRNVVGVIIVKAGAGEPQYLVLEKPRRQHDWQFPQGGVDAGETLLQAAYREVEEECGPIDILINSEPIGEYKYMFPESFQRHSHHIKGAHVTFFLAHYIDGDILVDGKEIVEYKWLTKDELIVYLEKTYRETIEPWI